MTDQTYVPNPTEQPLLRKRDVERLLGVSLRTLDRLIASGELPRVRIGGAVRFRPEDVRELVERSRVELQGGDGEEVTRAVSAT